MPGTKYGTAQRVAFAGLVIGAIMCTLGIIAPYWQTARLSVSPTFFGKKIPFIGNIKSVNFFGGIWWFCVEVPAVDERVCRFYSLDSKDTDNVAKDWTIRLASAVNVILAIVSSPVALCRTCCSEGGKTIFHGIMAFTAGTAGILAVAIFGTAASESFAMKENLVEFGWAFYVSAVGAGLITVVSFILCFASPEIPLTPRIVGSAGHAVPNVYMIQNETAGPSISPTAPGPFFMPASNKQQSY